MAKQKKVKMEIEVKSIFPNNPRKALANVFINAADELLSGLTDVEG